MKYFLLIFALLQAFNFNAFAQNNKKQQCKNTFLIAFYNTENLFDTIDDIHINDNDFLPSSKGNWTSERYNLKINMLAQVIRSYNRAKYADVIGLCEIENRQVLVDLIKSDTLKKASYSIAHFESPDRRGIDVAMLYRTKNLKVIYTRAITVTDTGRNALKTRDILYVKGITKSKDTLHFFVNHWPSRLGGQEESEGKRGIAANTLRTIIDSLFIANNKAKIVIMGDLNDEPNNESIESVLGAEPLASEVNDKHLYNLSYQKFIAGEGSYYYWKDKKWNMIDNIIVSTSLLNESNESRLKVQTKDVEIFKPDWLLQKEKNGVMAPFKTYAGKYQGGYSDHLSVYIILGTNCK